MEVLTGHPVRSSLHVGHPWPTGRVLKILLDAYIMDPMLPKADNSLQQEQQLHALSKQQAEPGRSTFVFVGFAMTVCLPLQVLLGFSAFARLAPGCSSDDARRARRKCTQTIDWSWAQAVVGSGCPPLLACRERILRL